LAAKSLTEWKTFWRTSRLNFVRQSASDNDKLSEFRATGREHQLTKKRIASEK
jgi:hypothetical protein